MAEESRMPPPPPPQRSSKPVPPPPPGGRAPMPPVPASPAGTAMPTASAMSGPAPIPFPPGGAPVGPVPPAMSGMTGMPGRALGDPRMQEMERRFQEQDEARKKLEEKTRELEARLKEEHEKVILQSLKAKEEESLSVRVEQQLREMQEKLRREKYEQELQESRGKAETQLKDMERRIAEERETWMTALKNQLKEREAIEREVEDNLTRRLREVEQRFQEEKNQWTLGMKQKIDEMAHQRRQFELDAEKWKEMLEDREEQVERVKEAALQDQRKLEAQHQAEYRALQAQIETHMREAGSWKAQVAMVQAQNQQLELQQQQDRSRMDGQLRSREEELKREYAMREHERTQHWEGVVHQVKAEKEALRSSMTRIEDEAGRLRTESLELKRVLEHERGEWQAAMEKARRQAREEALRDLPQAFEDRLIRERKELNEEHAKAMQGLQLQLVKSSEGFKALNAKFEIEHRRWEQQKGILNQSLDQVSQERATIEAELKKLKEDSEKQTKELFHHIAELQTKESTLREELHQEKDMLLAQVEDVKMEKERLDAAISASLKEAYEKEEQIKTYESKMETLKMHGEQLSKQQQELHQQLQDLTRQYEDAQAREALMKGSQGQLTTAFHNVQSELTRLQNEQNKTNQEWAEKEAAWLKSRSEFETIKIEAAMLKAELEKLRHAPPPAPTTVPATISPDAQKALSSIRQNMQELRTVLGGLRA